jgi:hypothetical protein
VDKAKSIQLFFRSAQPEAMVLHTIGQLIGIGVECLDVPVPDAVGFAQFIRYAEGFQQGVLVSWPSNIALALNEASLAVGIARHLKTEVLLERMAEPDRWILAKENSCATDARVTYLDDGIEPEPDR